MINLRFPLKAKSHQLLEDLKKTTIDILHQLDAQILPLSEEQLNWKASPDSWSVLECLQHLNLYGEFYIPAIGKAITNGKPGPQEAVFKSGLLGHYFAQSMLPKNGVVTNKMNTFKDKIPAKSDLTPAVLSVFKQQQEQFLQLLEAAKAIDINKAKTPITISNLIQLKLGDTFRFVINHHQRHMVQVANVIQGIAERKRE